MKLQVKIYWKGIMLLLLLTTNCTKEKTNIEIVKERCLFYDSIGYKKLSGYDIYNIRGKINSSYVVEKSSQYGRRAFIQIYPELLLEENFKFGDTLDMEFVKTFAYLGSNSFYSDSTFTKLRIELKDSIYIVFKGFPSQNYRLKRLNIKKSKSIIGNWKYYSLKRKK